MSRRLGVVVCIAALGIVLGVHQVRADLGRLDPIAEILQVRPFLSMSRGASRDGLPMQAGT